MKDKDEKIGMSEHHPPIVGLGTMPISIVLLIIVLVIAGISIASAYDIDGEEFTNRKLITIDNTGNANTLTDYQLKIEVNYELEMLPDFDDLRFTDSGGNVLSYWVEDFIPSTSATVWVKVTSIPGGGTTTMWMYYGNPSASSQSDGDATFVFFDDFEDGDYADKWLHTKFKDCSYGHDCVGYATWTEENGIITASDCCQNSVYCSQGPGVLISHKDIAVTNEGFVLDVTKSLATSSAGHSYISTCLVGTSMYADPIPFYDRHFGVGLNTYPVYEGPCVRIIYPLEYNYVILNWDTPLNVPFRYITKYKGSSGWDITIYDESGGIVHSADDAASYSETATLKVMLYAHSPGSFWDEVKVRKYADPEPEITFTSVPKIDSVEILNVNDIPTNTFTPGDTVKVKATISNPSQNRDYQVSVSMNIDEDTDGSNGAIYDSHLTLEDWDTDIDMGEQDSSTWSWVVPSQTEAEKTYYVAVGIHDQLNYYDICYDCPGYMWDFDARVIDLVNIVEITPPAGTELTYDEEVTFDLTVDYSLESLDQGRVELSLIGSGFGEGEQVVDWEQVSAGSGTVSFTRAARVALGSHERDSKFVVAVALADPNGAICLATDSVSYPISQPNLAFIYGGIFSPDGISIYPDELLVGAPVNIEVYWENKGEGWCEDDFDLIFYLGDPDVDNDGVIDDNANVIGSDHVDGLFPPDEGDLVVLEWTPSEFGTFDIYVVVDPEVDASDSKIGAVVESDEDDNKVHTSVVVRNPAIYGFVNVDTVPRTHVAGIPVYLYQEGKGHIGDNITDTDGFYKFKLSEEIDPTTDKFYVLAKWENDAVKIRDCTGAPIGAEVIRARWPPKGLLNEDIYMEIPLDGLWPEILFDDDDALIDYIDAKNIFEAINEAYDYVMDEKYYPIDGDNKPGMVDVYIHDPMVPCPQTHPFPGGGSIHFPLDHNHGYYSKETAYHEYGHAIHYQHGAGYGYNQKMAEGWAMYFESLLSGVGLEGNSNYCNALFSDYAHKWGLVYARIFYDLYDEVDKSDLDDYENGELEIWKTFMVDKVETIDEFYNKFLLRVGMDKKEAVRTIYATKRVKAPDYNGKFIDVDWPTFINQDEVATIHFKVKNYADYDDSYDVILPLWKRGFVDYNFLKYGEQEDETLTKRIDISDNSELEKDFKWKVDFDSSGIYLIQLAIVPIDWALNPSFCLDYDDYDNGWIDYKKCPYVFVRYKDLGFIGECPIDIEIVDPDGLTITKQSNGITDATYTETDINGDDDPDDIVLISNRKIGDYQITVTPEPDAEDTDTYTLKVTAGDTTIVLAEDVPISEIPDQPYMIRSTETGIIQIIPANVKIKPETLNLAGKGVFTAFIQLPEGYDVANINIGTVECEGAHAVKGIFADDNKYIAKFDREDLVGVEPGEAVALTVIGVLYDGTPFEGSDTIRVIAQGKGK